MLSSRHALPQTGRRQRRSLRPRASDASDVASQWQAQDEAAQAQVAAVQGEVEVRLRKLLQQTSQPVPAEPTCVAQLKPLRSALTLVVSPSRSSPGRLRAQIQATLAALCAGLVERESEVSLMLLARAHRCQPAARR